jgi:hypothetical protein
VSMGQLPYLPVIRLMRVLPMAPPRDAMASASQEISSWGNINVVATEQSIIFVTKPWSHGGWHYLALIDEGRLTVDPLPSGQVQVKLAISMTTGIGILLLFAFLATTATGRITSGFHVLAWLGGMNYLTAYLRSRARFKRVLGCFSDRRSDPPSAQ